MKLRHELSAFEAPARFFYHRGIPFISVENPLKQIEKTLFEGALNLRDPEVRDAFIEQSCRGNPVLRARLEKLLGLQSRAEMDA